MIPGKTYTPEDILWLVWCRKWLIIVPFILFAGATALWSRSLPNLYQSETVILVVPQRVPETYVRSTVTARIEDRLQSISPEILSRTRLERVIQALDLYVEQRRRLTMEEVVQRMRRDITVETVKGDAFRVSYISSDPRRAMQVTERLATMFIEGNLRDREILAEGTNEFLDSQLNDARARLIEHEKKLEEYRRRNAGELPANVDSNVQVIRNSQLQYQALGGTISDDRDRIIALEKLIADDLSADTARVPPPATPVEPVQPAAGSAAARLEAARNNLRSLQSRLTPQHPDVVRLQREIPELEQAARAEAQQAAQRIVEERPPTGPAPATVARQARIREMQAEVQSLRQQIAKKEAEQESLLAVIATYQRRVEAVPTREAELAELMRDYETLQTVYTNLLAKREDSQIAANLERRQIGEQFKILDPPRLPEKPFSPDRTKLNMFGALFGLALGAGLAALIEYRNTSLHTEEDVVTVLALPVLALIPAMMTDAERRRRHRRNLILRIAAAAVLLLGAAAAAAWRFGVLPKFGIDPKFGLPPWIG